MCHYFLVECLRVGGAKAKSSFAGVPVGSLKQWLAALKIWMANLVLGGSRGLLLSKRCCAEMRMTDLVWQGQ